MNGWSDDACRDDHIDRCVRGRSDIDTLTVDSTTEVVSPSLDPQTFSRKTYLGRYSCQGMRFPRSSPLSQLILFASLAGIALLSAVRVVEYNPIPWGWVIAFILGTAILVGPVMWGIRDRLPEKRREHLGYVAGGIALLGFPVILGLGLIFGNLLLFIDAGVFGSVIGFAVALLAEKIIIPEQLQSTTQ